MRKLGWGLLAGLAVVALGLGCWHAVARQPQRPSTPEAIVTLVWETFSAQEGVHSVETEIVPGDGGGITTTIRVGFGDEETIDPDPVDGAEVAELLEQVGTTLAPRLDKQDLDGLNVTVDWKRKDSSFSATYPLSDLIEPEYFAFSSPQRQQLRAASWYPGWNLSVAVDRDSFLVTHWGDGGRHRETLGEVIGSSRGFNRESWTHAGWQVTMAVSQDNRYFLPELLTIADSLPEVPEDQGAAMSYAPVDPGGETGDISDPNPHELFIAGMAAGELSDSEIAELVGRFDSLCVANQEKADLLDEVWLSWTAEARTDSSLSYTCGDGGLKVPDKASHHFDTEHSTAILEQARQS